MESNINVKVTVTEEDLKVLNRTPEEIVEYFRSELEGFICDDCSSEIKAGLLQIEVTNA